MGMRLLISPGNEDNSWEFLIYFARKRLYAVHCYNLCFRFYFSWRTNKFSRPETRWPMKHFKFTRYFKVFCKWWELCKLVCLWRKTFFIQEKERLQLRNCTLHYVLYIHSVCSERNGYIQYTCVHVHAWHTCITSVQSEALRAECI